MVPFTSNHFRGCVTWGSTCSFQSLIFIIHVGQAKVYNLDVVLIVEKQILWLQISVTNFDFVNVLNTRSNLLEETASLIFLETFSLYNVIK